MADKAESGDAGEGAVSLLLKKRLRAVQKKLARIAQINESKDAGKELNAEQVGADAVPHPRTAPAAGKRDTIPFARALTTRTSPPPHTSPDGPNQGLWSGVAIYTYTFQHMRKPCNNQTKPTVCLSPLPPV